MWGIVAGLPAGILGGPVAAVLHTPTSLMVGWVAAVGRYMARAPFGDLRMGHIAALGVVVALGAWARARGSTAGIRCCVASAAVVLVAAAIPAVHPRDVSGKEVTAGARLWRAGASTVLVIDGAPSAARLLTAMHKEAMEHIDVLVLVRPGVMAARTVGPLLSRYPPRLVLAPEEGRLERAVVPEESATYGIGSLAVEVGTVHPRLQVSVAVEK
jgi:hypothetical protein